MNFGKRLIPNWSDRFWDGPPQDRTMPICPLEGENSAPASAISISSACPSADDPPPSRGAASCAPCRKAPPIPSGLAVPSSPTPLDKYLIISYLFLELIHVCSSGAGPLTGPFLFSHTFAVTDHSCSFFCQMTTTMRIGMRTNKATVRNSCRIRTYASVSNQPTYNPFSIRTCEHTFP